MERGNEPATVDVRHHFYTAAALLAIGAFCVPFMAAQMPRFPEAAGLFALLGGLTLMLEGIILWYLPSFTKRRVILRTAAHVGPPAFIALVVLGALDAPPGIALGLALVSLATVVLASALAGPAWRGGVAFWRSDSPYRAGDGGAAIALGAGALACGVGGIAALAGSMDLAAPAWIVALYLLPLGALAHLVPRLRARPLAVAPFLAGVALIVAAPFLVLARIDPTFAAPVLLLPGLAIAAPGGAKRAGARSRDATPPLMAALVALALAAAMLLAGPRLAFPGTVALAVALGLGVAGLSLIALPVLFNQRPASAFVPWATAAALAGVFGFAFAHLLGRTLVPGAILLAAALLLWLAALAPLRRPRRYCPEPS